MWQKENINPGRLTAKCSDGAQKEMLGSQFRMKIIRRRTNLNKNEEKAKKKVI